MKEHCPISDGVVKPAEHLEGGSAHYKQTDPVYEPIKVIEAWGYLDNGPMFNVLKYIGRARFRPSSKDELKDLEKAKWYLEFEIKRLEQKCLISTPTNTKG